MANTKQPLLPSEDCTRDVRGSVTMPWCVEMVNSSASETAQARADAEYREGRRRAQLELRMGGHQGVRIEP